MLNLAKKIIINSPFENTVRRILKLSPRVEFKSSSDYWEKRYQVGGNSGSGSYGRLSLFKADFLNNFVVLNGIESVIEFGCGDGNQLKLAHYPAYIGVDVSETVVEHCRDLFAEDKTKKFIHTDSYSGEKADLAMSLDVIYHLVEDDIFENYMERLFHASEKYIAIYSSNYDNFDTDHVYHHKFSNWIDENRKDFELLSHTPNKFPYDKRDPDNTSVADFYIYKHK